MGLPLRDQLRHNYREYRQWPEDVRHELIDGEAYLMAPAPSTEHQRITGDLFRQIANALVGRRCEAFIAPFDVRLPKNNEADDDIETVVQPDVTVVCDPAKIDSKGCRGAPDWIIEVLSPRTAAHDQTVKLSAYERAGVKEVWLVHPTDRIVMVYQLENARYGRPAISEMVGELVAQSVPEVQIDWSRMITSES